jgi:Domain of unknown function (DUF1844)
MPKKEEPEFTVTDRRRFTSEGEATPQPPREEAPAEPPREQAPPQPAPNKVEPAAASEPPTPDDAVKDPRDVPPPSAAERQAQSDAFDASKKQVDAHFASKLGGRRPQDFEMSFERFMASLYMSALMQLGLMQEQGGQPTVDLFGARQTIDTLAILAEKTKGNLTMTEENLLQNCLYELRMAYVEVTNALARGPQPGAPSGNK